MSAECQSIFRTASVEQVCLSDATTAPATAAPHLWACVSSNEANKRRKTLLSQLGESQVMVLENVTSLSNCRRSWGGTRVRRWMKSHDGHAPSGVRPLCRDTETPMTEGHLESVLRLHLRSQVIRKETDSRQREAFSLNHWSSSFDALNALKSQVIWSAWTQTSRPNGDFSLEWNFTDRKVWNNGNKIPGSSSEPHDPSDHECLRK